MISRNSIFLVSSLSAFLMIGCKREAIIVEVSPPTPVAEPVARTKTLETSRLGAAIDLFQRESSFVNMAAVKKAFAELDGEIAELESLIARRTGEARAEAAAKLANLQAYRTAETARFAAAQAGAPVAGTLRGDDRTGAEKVEDTAKRVGNTIEHEARKAGDAIKDAVR